MSQNPVGRPEGPRGPSRRRLSAPAKSRPVRLYRLILQSGPIADLMLVVRTVMELTRLCRAEATHKMWEAHYFGRSQLLVTFLERAELYVEQFAAKGLTVTLEPA